jgi:hypothetical protein
MANNKNGKVLLKSNNKKKTRRGKLRGKQKIF